jgi:ribosome maturation factor RimP
VELKLFEAVDGEKEYTGILKAFDKDTVTIEAEGKEAQTFERSKLAVIRLKVDF